MNITTAPAFETMRTVELTQKGEAVLALCREQDALDAIDTAGRHRLDQAIGELLAD